MRAVILLPVALAACVSAPGGDPAPRAGPPPSITDAASAEGYVLAVAAQNGCTLSLDAFEARRAADGLSPTDADLTGPGGLAKLDQARLIDAAPFALIERGVLVPDGADSRRLTSRGAGCA